MAKKAKCVLCGATVTTRKQWLTEPCLKAPQSRKVKNMHMLAAADTGKLKGMKIIIEIETGNAAFEDNFGMELRSVLEQSWQKVHSMRTNQEGGQTSKRPLLDSSGNTVGSVRIEE